MSSGQVTPFPKNPVHEDVDLYSIPENTSIAELEIAVYELSKKNGDWEDGVKAASRKMLAASHLTALASHEVCGPHKPDNSDSGLPSGAALSLAASMMMIAEVAHRCGIDLEKEISRIQRYRIENPGMVPFSERLTAPATIYAQKERKS